MSNDTLSISYLNDMKKYFHLSNDILLLFLKKKKKQSLVVLLLLFFKKNTKVRCYIISSGQSFCFALLSLNFSKLQISVCLLVNFRFQLLVRDLEFDRTVFVRDLTTIPALNLGMKMCGDSISALFDLFPSEMITKT